MKKYTRYSLEERIRIEKHLERPSSLTTIARLLNRDFSGLRKEIKGHLVKTEVGARGRNLNNCAHRVTCQNRLVCGTCEHNLRPCRSCELCNSICNDFLFKQIHLLINSFFVHTSHPKSLLDLSFANSRFSHYFFLACLNFLIYLKYSIKR